MKKIFFVIALFSINLALFALPFNSKLSENELKDIQDGKVLVKSIDKYKNISLESENPGVLKLRQLIKELNPNYLAEIIQVRPIEGNENIAEKLVAVLSDVYGYVGIPYWSVTHQCYFDLYGNALVESVEKTDENTTLINAILEIGPFGFSRTPIYIEQTEDFVLYSITNSNNLAHKGITCVKNDNMLSLVLLFKDGDKWILYGAGCVKAPKIAIFEKRIETSFINKTKTFCQYVFSKMSEGAVEKK